MDNKSRQVRNDVARLQRSLRTISRCNRELFHARGEQELLQAICQILVETPEDNLSLAMQWVNGSYCVWFNLRHRRDGHLLQGRFKSFIVEDDAGWQEVARYVHLNPVRLKRLGLDKSDRADSHAVLPEHPAPELIAERLVQLRQFRCSSYRGYAGYTAPLAWV